MKSVAIYARVSSEQQAQQATIASQVAVLEQRAALDGQVVLASDRYIDEGFSGASLVRPALERLRDRIAEGGLDVLYVHCPDRLARRYAYQVLLLDEFSRQGVSVIFLNGAASRSAEDELLVQVQGMIAEYERAKILERCRRGKLHKARAGLINPLSGAPYGYLYVRRTDTEPASYQVVLHEAHVVRSVFQWFVEQQISIGAIVRRLHGQGISTRTGKATWDRSTIWAMLRNPAYKGQAAFGKTEAVEPGKLLRPIRSRSAIPRRAKSTYRDKQRHDWIAIAVPPLVSPDVFAQAQQQLERNRRLASRNGRGRRYLLQGLTVCAACGYAFYGKAVSLAAREGRAAYAYYRCVGSDGHRFEGGRVCHNPQVRVDQLDGHVWQSVCALLQDPARMLEEWSRRGASDGTTGPLRKQCDEARRLLQGQENTLRRLRDAYEAGALDLDDLAVRTERIRQRMQSSKQDLARAEQALAETVELTAVIGRLSDFSDKIRGGLDRLDWDQRRQIIRTLVARVEISDQGATVVYRVPTGSGPAPDGSCTPKDGSHSGGGDSICQLRGRGDLALDRESGAR